MVNKKILLNSFIKFDVSLMFHIVSQVEDIFVSHFPFLFTDVLYIFF